MPQIVGPSRLVSCRRRLLSVNTKHALCLTNSLHTGEKTVCYFTNWARYRPGGSKFYPQHIDPSVCTHILYSFATLNSNSLTIQVADPQTDIVNGYYAQVTALKSQGVKVSIALGGWGD